MRWLDPDLSERAGRVLLEALETACLKGRAARGWVLLHRPDGRLELIAALGRGAPVRRQLPGRLPDRSSRMEPRELRPICPYPDPEAAGVIRLDSGALVLEGDERIPHRTLDLVALVLDQVAARRDAEALRGSVGRIGEELEADLAQPAPGADPHELSSWHRRAAEVIASGHVEAALTDLAARAANLLGQPFSAVLILEGTAHRRIRLWGGEPMRELLGGTFPLQRLGALARRVLVEGRAYDSSRHPDPPAARRLYAKLGLNALLALPLRVEDRIFGALVLGDRWELIYRDEELNLVRLMAGQCALLLENALLASRVHLEQVMARAVLDGMADGVLTLDWEKRINSFNPAAERITGWRAADAVGRRCSEVLSPCYTGDDGCHSCPLLRLLEDPETMERGLTVEGLIQTRELRGRYVSSTYSVVAARGELLGSVVVLRDITEKKALEEMRSDYVTSISHDLKTPVTAIKGHALTLLRHGERLTERDRTASLEVINSGCDQVTRMFDNLIHLARFEAGRLSSYLEEVDLAAAARRVAALFGGASRRHAIELDVPSDLTVQADRDQLDQVLDNLVSNALKYSPDGGAVRLEAAASDGGVVVRVLDEGPGIPAERFPELFQKFGRLDPGPGKVRGAGLGLYITRSLVEAMGGEVGVESRPGAGSAFWFRLRGGAEGSPGEGTPEAAE